jgi:hypothetical protein
VRLDPETLITLSAAGVSAVAAGIAVWQAVSASRQARYAREQTDAAVLQAAEAERAGNAARFQRTVDGYNLIVRLMAAAGDTASATNAIVRILRSGGRMTTMIPHADELEAAASSAAVLYFECAPYVHDMPSELHLERFVHFMTSIPDLSRLGDRTQDSQIADRLEEYASRLHRYARAVQHKSRSWIIEAADREVRRTAGAAQ